MKKPFGKHQPILRQLRSTDFSPRLSVCVFNNDTVRRVTLANLEQTKTNDVLQATMLQVISGLSSDKNGGRETGKSHVLNAERKKKSTHNSVPTNILQEYGKIFIYSIIKR